MFIFDADTHMPSEPRAILPCFLTRKAMERNLSKCQCKKRTEPRQHCAYIDYYKMT